MLPKFNPEDFIFSFESSGVTLLFEDMCAKYYMYPGEWIIYHRDGKCPVYIKKDTVTKLNNEGSERTAAETEKIIQSLKLKVGEAKNLTSKHKLKENLLSEGVEATFKLMEDLMNDYVYFDFNYWDLVYEKVASSEEAKKNVDLVQSFKNVIRVDLNNIFFEAGGLLLTLQDQLSKQFNISRSKLDWYLIDDILGLFDNQRVSEGELKKRQKAYIFVQLNNKCTLYTADEAIEIFLPFTLLFDNKATEIKGKTAHNTGTVIEGKVRIISRNYGDEEEMRRKMAQMQKGEILVSETTEPALMPALEKASAIITDVGGMLSHAAITARELNIPCIVGTGSASKILKDGDLVEVDAEKGIVKKLS